MDDKIKELEKRISELESKYNLNNMFGRSYSQIGDSNSDFLIKTRGQVKIQWGQKFIDLIKDGKINVDSQTIFSVKSKDKIGSKEGIYFAEDEQQIYVKVSSSSPIPLAEDNLDSIFVSYNAQESNDDQKQQALLNLGLICTSTSIPQIENGFAYLTDTNEFCIIKDGIASKYQSDFPNSISIQLIIDQNTSKYSLVLKGTGEEHGLLFGDSRLYEENGIKLFSPINPISFIVNNSEILEISNFGITTNQTIKASQLESTDFSDSSGFQLKDGILTCDEVLERNPKIATTSDNNIFFHKARIIDSEEDDNDGKKITVTLDSSDFEVGDIVIIPTNYQEELESEDEDGDDNESENEDDDEEIISISEYTGKIISGENYEFVIQFDSEVYENLIGKYIYVLERGNQKALVIKNNSFNLGDFYIGYENNNLIARYPLDYDLSVTDNSEKLVSTKWFNEALPRGTIVAFGGSRVPILWHICNGTNGTPDLTDEFMDGTIYIMKLY